MYKLWWIKRVGVDCCTERGQTYKQSNKSGEQTKKQVNKSGVQTNKQANKSGEGGIEEAIQIINEFEERERIANDCVSYDFEINDYPSHARSKVLYL